jgi:hypothetical protein
LCALCHVCTFSLHRESPNMILGDEPLLSLGGFCHSHPFINLSMGMLK